MDTYWERNLIIMLTSFFINIILLWRTVNGQTHQIPHICAFITMISLRLFSHLCQRRHSCLHKQKLPLARTPQHSDTCSSKGGEKRPGSYQTVYLFLYITHSQTELLAETIEKPNRIINVSYGVVYLCWKWDLKMQNCSVWQIAVHVIIFSGFYNCRL